MLPTMASHGCPPEHHRLRLENDVVVCEECVRCGYRISTKPQAVDVSFRHRTQRR
ncbi:hypothetical protein ACFYWU_37375 [Streptomyces chrestomyceticus]|uniref:hypothetical protein n=1 Tax=Streptomyces chrestomyceticus TaxID=68185 RepID=UPI00369554DF